MPPKIDHGIALILDVGRNVAVSDEKNEKSFFEKARECASRVIESKILSQGNNYVGVILLGAKKTKNRMAEECDGLFKHVEVLADLQVPTWNMIRQLPEMPSKSRGDWIDALVVAADHFKNGTCEVTMLNKKIILMTNFQSPTSYSSEDINTILAGFVEENFEVDVIGLDLDNLEHNKMEDLMLAQKFVKKTKGATASFDYTMTYLNFHQKRIVKSMPWNVDLTIGPNIKIPVSAYIRLRSEPIVQPWKKAVKDPITSTASTSEGIFKERVHVNTENQSVVNMPEIIKGYHYGQRVIPFSECDKSMLYTSGQRSLSVYGFTHASNVTWQNLTGNGISYVFGRKDDEKAQKALTCLVECLHELNLIGIVRRVYNNNNAPKMYALMPVIDPGSYICLSMIQICFKDNIKYMSFPPTNLKKYACSDEQVDAFKVLIKAMDLTKAYDESYDDQEAFPIAETVSPSAQYVLDCIAFRALNPGKPLPQPRDDIMSIFKVPELIGKRSKDPLEKLKRLFILEKVEPKPARKPKQVLNNEELPTNDITNVAMQEMPKIQLPVKSEVSKIGTVNPVSDFNVLVNKLSLADVSKQMTDAIEKLIDLNLDGYYCKALEAMSALRDKCVESDPTIYNNWLQTLKIALRERKKDIVISVIAEKNVGFILKSENSMSMYEAQDSHEDSQLYENDTQPNSTQLTIRSEVNDMFDEM